MELNIHIFQDKLQKLGFSPVKQPDFECSICGTAYLGEKHLAAPKKLEARLVFVDGENIDLFLSNITKFPGCNVLCDEACLGKLPQLTQIQSLMVCPEDFDVRQAEEAAADIFRSFCAWREKIMLQIIEQKDIQTIVDSLSEMAANPFSLVDNNCFILARTKGYEDLPAGTIWDCMHGSYLSVFDFYTPKEWKEVSYQVQKHPGEPILFHPEHDKEHTYYMSHIILDGKPNASIGSLDILAPFTKGELAIMEQIRELVTIYLKTKFRASKSHVFINQTFNAMMNKAVISEQDISRMLDKRHWLKDDTYYLMAFRYPVILNAEAELASYINIIHMQFPKAMAAVANQAILLVVRTKDYALDAEAMQDKLNTFLDRSNLRCGYSFPFYHFEDCLHHLNPALYAASQAEATGIPVVYYGDVQTRHILQLLTQNTELEYMAHPMIIELARSEKKSDRALVECLRAYLLNGRSISATVRALDLHRNTVVYRIQRLQEILGVAFDSMSEETLFSLLLSCLIVQEETLSQTNGENGEK